MKSKVSIRSFLGIKDEPHGWLGTLAAIILIATIGMVVGGVAFTACEKPAQAGICVPRCSK